MGLTFPASDVDVTTGSGSLTTGTVLNGSSEDRGSRLALHSIIGFLGGALGGPVVGLALDSFGGENSKLSWSIGFVALGLGSLLSSYVLKKIQNII